MKTLLAYLSGRPDRSDPYISLVPTGVCSLHAVLRDAGHDALLVNFSGWTAREIERELVAYAPDLIGISQWTHNRHAALELARTCRRLFPKAVIVMGGAHATFCYCDLLAADSPLDLVVLGEGEQTLLELVERLEQSRPWQDVRGIAFRSDGRVVETPHREQLADLDSLPYPSEYFDAARGLDLGLQPEFILSARGCPSACHFCSSPAFWGRAVRFRSPARIVDEIMQVRERYGLIYFSMRDDTFTANRLRTLEFCRLLEERRAGVLWNCQSRATALDAELLRAMKRAGCECIQLGVESGAPEVLRQLGKMITPSQVEHAAAMIREVGIHLSIYLISDVPSETDDDFQQTTALVRRIHPDDGYVSPLAYFPGTRLFNEAVAMGRAAESVFAESAQEAVYVASKPGKRGQRLLKVVGSSGRQSAELFKRQKQELGFCWTTNVLAGEWLRQNGELRAAAAEFSEVTRRQADNPWGWYLLAELLLEQGRLSEARMNYRRVVELVPRHAASLEALREL